MKKLLKNTHHLKGVTVLITVIVLGSIIVIVSFTTVILAYWEQGSVYSKLKTTEAYYLAYSGIQDAVLKISRNKDLPSSTSTLPVGSGTSTLNVLINTPSTGLFTIYSTGAVGNSNRKLRVIINVNPTSSLVTPSSTSELTL